jgi:hypothetical protein
MVRLGAVLCGALFLAMVIACGDPRRQGSITGGNGQTTTQSTDAESAIEARIAEAAAQSKQGPGPIGVLRSDQPGGDQPIYGVRRRTMPSGQDVLQVRVMDRGNPTWIDADATKVEIFKL